MIIESTIRKTGSAWSSIIRHPTAVVVAILAVFITVGIFSASLKAPTFDEPAHLLGGYTTLTMQTYHVNPENGLLPQVWSAIPLALSPGIIHPDTKSQPWNSGLSWNAASNFLFSSGNDHEKLLIMARTMTLLMAALCGLLVFLISKRIWGTGGGFISLTLFVLSPTIMANARLVTSDIASALFFLLSIWSYQLVSERITLKRLTVFCVGMSCLFLSKMSAPIVIPALLALLAVRLFRRKPLRVHFGSANFTIAGQFKQTLLLVAIIALAGSAIFATIWASSSFRYSMLPDNNLRALQNNKWQWIKTDKSIPVRVVLFSKSHELLPEYYLYGMAHVIHDSKLRHAFLNGKRSETGWWYFFPATFAMKTPPAMILLFLAGLVAPFVMMRKKRKIEEGNVQCRISNNQYSMGKLRCVSILRNLAFAFILIATYGIFALSTNLNIGHRHLLPIYPPLFIIAGGIAYAVTQASRLIPPMSSNRLGCPRLPQNACRLILSLSLIALLMESILIYPDYLAYFSPVVGGASNGYKHLVDSSLDWGQDLKRLKMYIQHERNRGEKHIYSAYFGSVNLTAYKLPGERLLCAFEQFSYGIFSLEPGTYCISATMLQMDYYPKLAEWNPELEKMFRYYRGRFRELRAVITKGKKTTESAKRKNELFRDYKVFEKLRFAKLAAALREKTADDNIGHSILIYKLSKQELHDILNN